MRITNWIMTMFLLAAGLALVGCGKKEAPAPVMQGVSVDLPKLREAFATASPELQNAVSEVAMGVRYNDSSSALAALGKLANAPSLTQPQQKIVNEVIEQVKHLAGKTTAPSAR